MKSGFHTQKNKPFPSSSVGRSAVSDVPHLFCVADDKVQKQTKKNEHRAEMSYGEGLEKRVVWLLFQQRERDGLLDRMSAFRVQLIRGIKLIRPAKISARDAAKVAVTFL